MKTLTFCLFFFFPFNLINSQGSWSGTPLQWQVINEESFSVNQKIAFIKATNDENMTLRVIYDLNKPKSNPIIQIMMNKDNHSVKDLIFRFDGDATTYKFFGLKEERNESKTATYLGSNINGYIISSDFNAPFHPITDSDIKSIQLVNVKDILQLMRSHNKMFFKVSYEKFDGNSYIDEIEFSLKNAKNAFNALN